jgi:hypothetical protein
VVGIGIDHEHVGLCFAHSSHSPILTAVKDLFDEPEMWDRISKCDINQNWSASIIQNKGKLRAYFCEVAAAFDLARGTDHGIEVTPDWWRRHISEFEQQVSHFCPGCGVPAKATPYMDFEETDIYTGSNADLAEKSLKKKRRIVQVTRAALTVANPHKVTQYSPNLKAPPVHRFRLKRYLAGRLKSFLSR